MKLTIKQKKILKAMFDWGEWQDGGGIWKKYSVLSEDTGIDIKTLTKEMKVLGKTGLVHYGVLVNQDHNPSGSGWTIGERSWDKVKEMFDDIDGTEIENHIFSDGKHFISVNKVIDIINSQAYVIDKTINAPSLIKDIEDLLK